MCGGRWRAGGCEARAAGITRKIAMTTVTISVSVGRAGAVGGRGEITGRTHHADWTLTFCCWSEEKKSNRQILSKKFEY